MREFTYYFMHIGDGQIAKKERKKVAWRIQASTICGIRRKFGPQKFIVPGLTFHFCQKLFLRVELII